MPKIPADARGLHRLLHHPQRQGSQHRPTQPDHLHARVHQGPPSAEAGDSGLTQVGGAHAATPLHGPAQRHRAAPAADAALSVDEATRDIDDLGWRESPLLSVRAGAMSSPAAAAAAAETPMPISTIVPGSAERISPLSQLSASSPLPPAPPAAARKKRSAAGKGEAATRTKRRRVTVRPSRWPPPPSDAARPSSASAHRPSANELAPASA